MKVTDQMIAAAEAARSGREMPHGYTLLHTATILREGWELDNKLWIIQGPTRRFSAGTNHGGLRVPADDDIGELITEHKEALASLRDAARLLTA